MTAVTFRQAAGRCHRPRRRTGTSATVGPSPPNGAALGGQAPDGGRTEAVIGEISQRQLLTCVAAWRGILAVHPTGLWPQLDEALGIWALGPEPSAEFPLPPSRNEDSEVLDHLCWGSRDGGRPTSERECGRLVIHMLRLDHDEHDARARTRAVHCARLVSRRA